MASKRTVKKISRKPKTVRFQDNHHVIKIDYRGVWYSPEKLRSMQDDACDAGRRAQQDRRITLWNATFQDPVACGLLSLWTTNWNSLRGLERFVSQDYRHNIVAEHHGRVNAVLSAQGHLGKLSEEVADISRAYSHRAQSVAAQFGLADAFAAAADDLKSQRIALLRQCLARGSDYSPQLSEIPKHSFSLNGILDAQVGSSPKQEDASIA